MDSSNMSGRLDQNSSANSSARQEGNMWGGFGGGDWTVNQKGSGVQPWMLIAGIAVVLLLNKRGKA